MAAGLLSYVVLMVAGVYGQAAAAGAPLKWWAPVVSAAVAVGILAAAFRLRRYGWQAPLTRHVRR
jgi:hypothetical protein